MDNDLYDEISDIMLKLGLQPKFAGFEYMREAIWIFLRDNKTGEKITTEVYPQVAKKFCVSHLIVERNIRIMISDAFKKGGLLGINEFYESIVYTNSFPLSNNELISVVVEILKLKQLKEKLVVCEG